MSKLYSLITILHDMLQDSCPRMARTLDGDYRLSLRKYIDLIPSNVSEDIDKVITFLLGSLKYLNVEKICTSMEPVTIDSKKYTMSMIGGKLQNFSFSVFDPIFNSIDFIAQNPQETLGTWLRNQSTDEVDF